MLYIVAVRFLSLLITNKMSGSEAYFGEGAKHRKYHRVSHTASGRRHKAGDGFWDDFKSGFKSVFDPVGKPLLGLLPGGNLIKSGMESVGLGRPRRSAGDGRRRLHSRLAHHELGFQGMGESSGDLADLAYFEGSAGPSRSGGMYASHSGGRRHHRRGADADADGDGRRKHHRRGADADGEGRKKRKPSARNMIVKKVMMEMGLSLPEASKYVKQHNLY